MEPPTEASTARRLEPPLPMQSVARARLLPSPAYGEKHGWGRVGRRLASADGRGGRTAGVAGRCGIAPQQQPVSAAADDCFAHAPRRRADDRVGDKGIVGVERLQTPALGATCLSIYARLRDFARLL
jgi:hypothetical protein